jgi:hypothetical protein
MLITLDISWVCHMLSPSKKGRYRLGSSLLKYEHITHCLRTYWALVKLAWDQSVATKDCRQNKRQLWDSNSLSQHLRHTKWCAVCTSDNYTQQKQQIMISIGITDTFVGMDFRTEVLLVSSSCTFLPELNMTA